MAGGLSLMNGAWRVGTWVGPDPKFFQVSNRMNFEGKEYYWMITAFLILKLEKLRE